MTKSEKLKLLRKKRIKCRKLNKKGILVDISGLSKETTAWVMKLIEQQQP